jgi:hypothetical protein
MNRLRQYQCPLCWHEETMIARHNKREPIRDHMMDICKMGFVPPYGGARGQQITRWDQGLYECAVCGARLNESDLHILLDAVGITDAAAQQPDGQGKS